jgi:hypothetical protein
MFYAKIYPSKNTCPMGRMLVRGRGYTWLGLHGTNGSPEIPLPRPYIYIYGGYIRSPRIPIVRGSTGRPLLTRLDHVGVPTRISCQAVGCVPGHAPGQNCPMCKSNSRSNNQPPAWDAILKLLLCFLRK